MARVVANDDEGLSSRRLRLRVPDFPGFAPGQFAMLSAGPLLAVPRTDPLLPRPMALYRDFQTAGGPGVEILYKVAGRGTSLLAEALPGQEVSIVAPLGRAFPRPAPAERVLIVAGGTGIASVFDLAAQLGSSHRPTVLLGARTEGDLMAVEDFESLGIALQIATDDGSRGTPGQVTDLLSAALESTESTRVFTCGPTRMMHRCAQICADASLPCVAALENNMACGFGVCLGCAAPLVRGGYALVCRDGPAFDAASIAWDRLP
ncbi:MAG: dihydroorotate dehydrogenase electron transfer subunit [Myxococcota bacterium]